jgi:hypothetical protein
MRVVAKDFELRLEFVDKPMTTTHDFCQHGWIDGESFVLMAVTPLPESIGSGRQFLNKINLAALC